MHKFSSRYIISLRNTCANIGEININSVLHVGLMSIIRNTGDEGLAQLAEENIKHLTPMARQEITRRTAKGSDVSFRFASLRHANADVALRTPTIFNK